MSASLRLTPQQRQSLKRRLEATQDKWEYRRILAVLNAEEENSVAHAARTLKVSRQSVHKWINALQSGSSIRVLRTQARSGRPSIWSKRAIRILRNSFKHPPDYWGYRATDWTVSLLQDRLLRVGKLSVGEEALRKKLHELKRSWKRKRHRLKPDPQRAKKNAKSAGELSTLSNAV